MTIFFGNDNWRGVPDDDWRYAKKMERKFGLSPVRLAYGKGFRAAEYYGDYRNPYPPGLRHDEWEAGYKRGCEAVANEMNDWDASFALAAESFDYSLPEDDFYEDDGP